VVSQTIGGDDGVMLDARVPAVAAAGVMLWLRTPFIVVIAGAALIAALLRFFLGIP
jgi:hypothetical protein